MRQPFNAQPDLKVLPIEKIPLPLNSRDELPPILAGLQWIRMHPTLKGRILDRSPCASRWTPACWKPACISPPT